MKGQDKVEYVMGEFKRGKLKDKAGNVVTDKNQALAIALSEAGLSNKSLRKAEIRNSLILYRKQLQRMLYKEQMQGKTIRAEIMKLFRTNPSISDNDVHMLADRLGISAHVLETYIYAMLRSLVAGGKSNGEEKPVNPDELEMGIETEYEHTDDAELAEKIARDHLAEIPDYYTRLKQMELRAKGKQAEANLIQPSVEGENKVIEDKLPKGELA